MNPNFWRVKARCQSTIQSEDKILDSLKRYLIDNLKIKQAFLNCILVLFNNFLAYEVVEIDDSVSFDYL